MRVSLAAVAGHNTVALHIADEHLYLYLYLVGGYENKTSVIWRSPVI